MTNIESFINSYNKLDSFMRKKLNCDMSLSHAKLLAQMSKTDNVFSRLETKLQAYRALRNAIVHIHHEGETPIAIPNADVVNDYKKIVSYAISPPLAIDSIAVTNVYSVEWETKIADVNHLMFSKGLSIIPIVKEDKIEGIFSSWFLQKYLFETNINLHRGMPIVEMYKELNFNHPISYIHNIFRVDFQKTDATIDDIVNCFLNSAKSGSYFKAVYLTTSGKPFEKISGVITPHCLPSINPSMLDKTINI